MKVSKDHYEILKSWTVKAMADKGINKNAWELLYKENTKQRKVWDLYWFTMSSNVMASQIIRPLFDDYNDSHIETALNKLYSELN